MELRVVVRYTGLTMNTRRLATLICYENVLLLISFLWYPTEVSYELST